MRHLILLLLVLLPISARAQWTDGGRDQAGNNLGNGAMITSGSTLHFWNGTNGLQRSTDNGQTWQDPSTVDNDGQNGFVAKMTATQGRIYAARSYGSGNGLLQYSDDDGLTWKDDTVGAQKHALGWPGWAVISDMHAWAGHLFIKWDAPDAYDIKPINGAYARPSFLATHDPMGVASIGDTLFIISDKLYFTTDFGVTWQTPANVGFLSGTMLRADGEKLYMMAPDGFNQPLHLRISEDRGESWSKIDITPVSARTGLFGLTAPTAYFVKGQKIYIGTQAVQYFNSKPNVFKSSDGGASWAVDSNGLVAPYYSSVVGLHYHKDGQIWLIPGLDNIYKQKLDDGASGGPGITGTTKLLAPRTGSVLQEGIVRFLWTKVSGAITYQLQISTAADFSTLIHNDSSVTDTSKLVELNVGAKYYWRVRGVAPGKIKPKGGAVQKLSEWTLGSFTISADRSGWENMGVNAIFEMTFHKDALYLATQRGIIKSSDGKTWTPLPSYGLDTMTTSQIVSAGERLYVIAYDPHGEPNHLIYTTNDGATWTIDTAGMSEASYVGGLIYFADHLFIQKAGTGQAFYKAINGSTWIEDETSMGINYVADGSTLFTDGGITGKGYQKSTDFGATWQPITGPTTGPDGQEGLYAFDGKLYAITQKDSPFDSLSLFVSNDEGASWNEIILGPFAAPDKPQFGNQLRASSFLVDGDRMWISVDYGSALDVVYRSLDAGASWKIDTAGAWEQFKGAHFNRMIMHNGTVWAVSGGPEDGPGTLYRQRIDTSEQGPELAAPTLLSPANDADLNSPYFDYSWQGVSGASSYQLQVSLIGDFSQSIYQNDSLVLGLSKTNSAITMWTDFYWRVRALNGESVGPWSSVWHYTVPLGDVNIELEQGPISVYPNPSLGFVTIATTEESIESVSIITPSGAIVMRYESTSSGQPLDLNGISSGSYTLLIELTNGRRYLEKLIVE